MIYACIADLHGHLPDLSSLEFDVLLIGGDITPGPARDHGRAARWLDVKLRRWLERVGRPVFAVAGNHDFIFEERPDMVPDDLPWTYLQDSGAVLPDGLKIWGSPWQPYFGGWSFNLHEDQFVDELAEKWAMIPGDTDVLLLHGPPHGHGDSVPDGRANVGSRSLARRIGEVRPRITCCGHIHGARGVYFLDDAEPRRFIVNAAHCDESYRPVNPPIVINLADGQPGDES